MRFLFEPHDAGPLAKRLSAIGLLISTEELPEVIPSILKGLGHGSGSYYVPQLVQIVEKILEGRSATVVCDPWAGIGEFLAIVCVATHAEKALALSRNQLEGALGRLLFRAAEWQYGEPRELLTR